MFVERPIAASATVTRKREVMLNALRTAGGHDITLANALKATNAATNGGTTCVKRIRCR
jgi:hypothetical protein